MAYDGDEEVHGGDNLGKTKTRKHDKSRNKDEAQLPDSEAIMNVEDGEGSGSSSLDERIVSAEAGLAVLGYRFKTLESNVGTLEAAALEGLDEVKAYLSEQNEEHKEGLTSLELKLTKALSALHEEFGSKLSEQQLEAARVDGNHGSVAYHDARIEAPKPNVFNGERNAQDVENFIWQLESYFEHVKIVDGVARIRIATMYFSDVAMLWWHRKKVYMERGLCTIADWDQFKDELKEQFYPQNVVDEARRKLWELKQTSSIHNYVREFTKLSLLVTSFSSEDLLFFFLDGLQNWAKQELRRRNVKTVDEAIKVAESLTDFHADYAKAKDSQNKPVDAKGDRGDKGKDKFIPNKNFEFKRERNQPSSFRKNYEEKKKVVANRDRGCYLCGDIFHFVRSFPSLSKLGVMIAATQKDQASAQAGGFGEQEAQAANSEKGKGHAVGLFNHMALFNHMTLAALATKKHSVRPRESLFVDGEVNGRAVHIMVDTGATHNFVTEEKAKELGVAFVTSDSMLKTVNCLPTNVNGLDPRVSLTLGGWKGEMDFSVVLMNVFDIVLGMDFWYEINAFILPHLNHLAIYDVGGSCIVPLIRVAQSGKRLSAMQLIKGFKKGEPTFLATLMEIVGWQEAELVPSCVQRVLEENKDVMPEELPKRLPP
ncbi:putative polyprotein P3-like [Capsicum annuum]|nr:putative polyprotein P3-like [Capsicum annuum]